MEKSNNKFKTKIRWTLDECEITTSEENKIRSEVTLLIDMKRGTYYVLPSENKKRDLASISRILKYLKKNYIDKIAIYSNGESLEAMIGETFNPKLNENGDLEKRTGSLVSYSRENLKKCIDSDNSIKKLSYSETYDEVPLIIRR